MHEELKGLVRKPDFTRREFVVTTLATGFALSVQPISAQTITTDTSGLEAGEVKIPVADGELPAYRAMPKGGDNLATVIVVQEIFGVHEHIKDLCRRLAKVGYLAVAPELYARQGDVSKMTDIREVISKIVSKVGDAQVMTDLDSTAAWAAKNHGNADKLAITGFCWGGRIVWLYSAHSEKLKAGVAWYGRLKQQDPDELHPKGPIDLVVRLKAPVLGLYGAKDTGINADAVEAMRQAIMAASKPSEIVVYPDAEHGFNADYRPSYNKHDAEDGWQRMLAWFKKYGVV